MSWIRVVFDDINLAISFLSLVLSFFALLISTGLTIVIFRYQKKQDKKLAELQKEIYHKEILEKAKSFMIDNADEMAYLPFCIFATNLYPLKKHRRKIYTEFCRCSSEVQKEILLQNNINIEQLDNEWINKAIELLSNDIKNHELGINILYDGAKYFHRSIEYYRNNKWTHNDLEYIFPIIGRNIGSKIVQPLNLISYVDEYMHFKYSEYRPHIINPNPVPPIDFVWNLMNLGTTSEHEVCAWTMEIIYSIAQIISSSRYTADQKLDNLIPETDADIETFEDKYYQTVQALYNTYYKKIK